MRGKKRAMLQANKPKRQEILQVKESRKEVPAKRVNIVSLKMVRDLIIHCENRHIRSPKDSYNNIEKASHIKIN